MKRWAALWAAAGLTSAKFAQGPIPGQSQPPRDDPPRQGGIGGIGLSISLGGKKKVKPLELRDAESPDAVAGQIIFTISNQSDPAKIASSAQLNLIESAPLDSIGIVMVVAAIAQGDSISAATARLQTINGVIAAQPNHLFQSHGTGKEKAKGRPPKRLSLHAIPQSPVAGRIAMVDTPVDLGHEVLKGARVTQSSYGVPIASGAHGTAIASLLVGEGGVPGSAQGANFHVYAAFSESKSRVALSQTRNLARAMDAALRAQPSVLVLAFGGRDDPLLARLLDAAHAQGICVVAAVGNGGSKAPVSFPASHRHSIGVTAVDTKLKLYPHASRGNAVDFAGIGVGQLVAVPGGYRTMSGTSFAAATLAGAMLRVPQCNGNRNPDGAMSAMVATAQDLGSKGRDLDFGAGLLRLTVKK
jgi:Subtilase family